MVQRKAFNKLLGRPTEPRIRGGKAGGGEANAGDDLVKILKKKKPNYMKPTASSDARTAPPQVTTTSHAKPTSSSTVRPYKIKPTKATCSSFLKDAKFPKALELHPGGTEAQGTSTMRVCPYTYCSLNGHRHEHLPSLRSVISSRRKLLNTQKSFKHKGQPLNKVEGLVKDDKEVDDDFFVDIYAKVKKSQDVEIDRQSENNIQKQLENKDGYSSDMHVGDDYEKKSELSVEENESMLSLLEFVECDWMSESKEENQPSLVLEGRKPNIIPPSKASGISCGEDDGPDPKYEVCYSDYRDDVLSPKFLSAREKKAAVDELPFDPSSNICEESEKDIEQLSDVYENKDQALELAMLETEKNVHDEFLNNEISSHGTEEEDVDDPLITETTINLEDDINYDTDEVTETADGAKSRMRIIRETTTEEQEQMREFNPRSPRFLEIEADPEAEKVDLRHQMTDERKNAEEWMIDYALQRALSNLESARKRKVALLVKAFETVKPLSLCEEPPRYATSGFAHSRIIQSCS